MAIRLCWVYNDKPLYGISKRELGKRVQKCVLEWLRENEDKLPRLGRRKFKRLVAQLSKYMRYKFPDDFFKETLRIP